MAYQEKQLQEISKQFQIYGEILHAETLKIGHINETYSATYDQGGMRVQSSDDPHETDKTRPDVVVRCGALGTKNYIEETVHLEAVDFRIDLARVYFGVTL